MFSQFIRERQYLTNVSPATLAWYTTSLKWLPSESPTQDDLKNTVLRMRERGLKATGCNCVIRAVNSYLHWSASTEKKCGPGCAHLRIPQLKEPQFLPPTFTTAQVTLLVNWKPKGFYQRRLHLLVLFLLDSGCRITEALTLRVPDLDLDNLLVTLDGKGRKQRVVPFSLELRKVLFRYVTEHCKADALLLATENGTQLGRRDALRDVKRLCRRLGFSPPPRTLHSFRHTFGLNYIRRGGNVFALQRILGHSSLEMTRRYVSLNTEDLQAVHERVSLLSR